MSTVTIDPIVIVGAGPSGLLLARYLQLHSIPCVIYEKEPSQFSRLQGGTLDLHEDTGLLALRETGLLEEASTMMRGEGEAFKIVDQDGKVYMDENSYDKEGKVIFNETVRAGEIKGRPEIDRTDLRNLLISSLEPDTIKWGHSITSCVALDNSQYQLTFASHPTVTTPYLVGADGTFSLVRPLLHSSKPEYSGLMMYDLTVPASSMTPALKQYVGSGSVMALGDGKGVMPQMNSKGKCKVYAALKVPEDWPDKNPLPEQGKLEHIASLYNGWHKEAIDIILASDEDSVTQRRIWQSDPDLKWESDLTGVTIMGDAAHPVSPFAGEGLNQALADALDLGRTLVSLFTVPPQRASLPPFPLSLFPIAPALATKPHIAAPSSQKLHGALRVYERRIMRRMREYAIESKQNLEICFGPEPAKSFVSSFRWMMVSAIAGMVVRAPLTLVQKVWRDLA